MLDISQFRQYIITPALSNLQLYSKDAEELLVFTCAVESDGGTFLHQISGPAVGIYQCEPNTHNDIWRNYIIHRNNYVSQLGLNFGVSTIPDVSRLMSDLLYASAICRLHYRRVKEALPPADDAEKLYDYYKQYYNTSAGKSKKATSLRKYQAFLRT